MVEHSRQALVGAIGGTYISLAIADIDELSLSNFALLNSDNFKSPMEAIARYLQSVPRCPDKVGLAVAGRVTGEEASMSNLPWTFDWNDIRATTGAKYINFVNEFEALALAAPHMSSYDLVTLNVGEPSRYGTRVAVSAGTGVGAAALIWAGDKWVAASGESRYASFPAALEEEFDLQSLRVGKAQLTAGDVLTGKGMVAVYESLLHTASGGEPVRLTPEEITKAGLSGENPVARKALDLMILWLGRFAGDAALYLGGIGGVYLSGGMPSNLLSPLSAERFREGFEGSGARQEHLQNVPVFVIKTGADAGMRGAAVSLANSLPARGAQVGRLSA